MATHRLIPTSLVLALLAFSAWEPSHAAERVEIPANADATMIEDSEGALANGSGERLFSGRTAQVPGGIRRALLKFDVAAYVPRGAVIEDAWLVLAVAPSNSGDRVHRLHRLLADWNEGPSSSAGGRGAPSETGDVTWIHRFFDDVTWTTAGGQFAGRPSAEAVVGAPGFYEWRDTKQLVKDVRRWRNAPHKNFGWIVIGDETEPQTAKAFVSREFPESALWPRLVVEYRVPGRAPSRGR